MEKKSDVNFPSAPQRGLSRREMVQRLFGGASVAFVAPGVSGTHPVHKHLADAAVLARADAQAAEKDWSPAFLDAHQNETLIVLAELIVPGSTKAQVNRFIDLLLTVETPDNQKKFVASLSAFDAEGLDQHDHPFIALTQEQQTGILTDASTAGTAEGPAGRRRRRRGPPTPGVAQTPEQALRDHFENLKSWISGAYYSSEAGMRELGWTGNYIFESFPGCQHPEGHH
ncbi:MAG TPA: gluconate 2-dehydrogenase subunit 3 family protein [Terriglobia bacterium]|nr:gluconate 2-dehydrogenase subunit 3 family protein [Terriglobia bacterium]